MPKSQNNPVSPHVLAGVLPKRTRVDVPRDRYLMRGTAPHRTAPHRAAIATTTTNRPQFVTAWAAPHEIHPFDHGRSAISTHSPP